MHNLSNVYKKKFEVHCLYGTGIKTPGKFTWNKISHFPDSQPDNTVYDDGDGTVNIRSLETCKSWNVENNAEQIVSLLNNKKKIFQSLASKTEKKVIIYL